MSKKKEDLHDINQNFFLPVIGLNKFKYLYQNIVTELLKKIFKKSPKIKFKLFSFYFF